MDAKLIEQRQWQIATEFLFFLRQVPPAMAHCLGIKGVMRETLFEYAALGEVADELLLAPVSVGVKAFKDGRLELKATTRYEPAKMASLLFAYAPDRRSGPVTTFFIRKRALVEKIIPARTREGLIYGCRLSYRMDGRLSCVVAEFPFVKYIAENRDKARLFLWHRNSLFSDLPLEIKKIIVKYIFVARVGG